MSLTPLSDILKTESPTTTPAQRTYKPPSCHICGDAGTVWVGEHSRPCACPVGLSRQKAQWLEASGVPLARQGETLDAFHPIPGTGEALAAALAFARGELTWLLLYGGVGNGKSHLANGVVTACIEAGRRARVVNALLLLSDLRAVSGTPRMTEVMRDLGVVPLLVIDDYIWATDLEGRWLEEIVQRRYLEKRPLMVTTNRDLKDLPAPMVSRFLELGQVVLNRGRDYRKHGG